MKVRAAVLHEVGAPLSVDELELAEPGPGEVRLRVMAAGVCHSDLHVVTGDIPQPLPVVLGHEGAGLVEAVGPGVTHVQPGDRVVTSWIPACGQCHFCRVGRAELCDEAGALAVTGTLRDGTTRFEKDGQPVHHFLQVSAFAERIVVPAGGVVPVPPEVPWDRAALLGCGVTTGAGAVWHTARVRPGKSVVVIGCGGVGLSAVQAAALAGAWPIIAVDVVPEKLAVARRLGASHTVDAREHDVVTAVVDLTDGLGADYAFEAVGRPDTIAQAFGAVRKGGMAVVVGVAPPNAEVCINAFALPAHEKVLTGSWFGQSNPHVDVPRLARLYLAGKFKLDELISRRYRLDEINAAFDDLRRGQVLRGVVQFD